SAFTELPRSLGPFKTVTTIWETWVPLGEGELYTTCDKIPRWRWSSTPTTSTPSTVTQYWTELGRTWGTKQATWIPSNKTLTNWYGQPWSMTDDGVLSKMTKILSNDEPNCRANTNYCSFKDDSSFAYMFYNWDDLVEQFACKEYYESSV